MNYRCIICLLAFSSCNNIKKDKEEVRYPTIDYLEVTSILDSLNAELQRQMDSTGMYDQPVMILNKNKKQLVFFGANHTRDKAHHQFTQLRELFDRSNPQIAFNEGGQIPYDRKYPDYDSAIAKNGETGALKYLSDKAGIKMMNGDLEENLEFGELLKTIPKDELYLYIAVERYLNQHKHNRFPGMTLEESFEKKFINYLAESGFPLTEEERKFSYLTGLYKRHLKKDLNLDSLVEIQEYYLFDTGVFGRVGRATKEVRDQGLLRKIDKALDEYDRVFVVFGASHIFAVRPALKVIMEKDRSKAHQ